MKIHIEFCIKWNYGPEFDRVPEIIKRTNPKVQIEGNNFPPRSGAFEVIINGKLIFSKFESGVFPDDLTIKKWIK